MRTRLSTSLLFVLLSAPVCLRGTAFAQDATPTPKNNQPNFFDQDMKSGIVDRPTFGLKRTPGQQYPIENNHQNTKPKVPHTLVPEIQANPLGEFLPSSHPSPNPTLEPTPQPTPEPTPVETPTPQIRVEEPQIGPDGSSGYIRGVMDQFKQQTQPIPEEPTEELPKKRPKRPESNTF